MGTTICLPPRLLLRIMQFIEQFLTAVVLAFAETAPLLMLGFAVAGLIREFVPQDTMRRTLGGKGLGPLMRAVGIGAVLPICSCSTIPLGLGLVRSGAARGTVLAFMTSSPAVSPMAIVLGLAVLGPGLLALYVGTVLIGAVAMGGIGNRLLRSDAGDQETAAGGDSCCHSDSTAMGVPARIVRALRWSLFDLASDISGSLILGLAVAAAVLTAVPQSWMEQWLGGAGPLALVAVIAFAIPVYTCSVAALIVAGSLLAKGAGAALAIAFLVAGPATNLGELNAIRVGMGFRAVLLYAVVLVGMALSGGLLAEQIPLAGIDSRTAPSTDEVKGGMAIDATDVHASGGHATDRPPELSGVAPWRWPFVAMLVATLLTGVIKQVRTATESRTTNTT